MESIDTTELYEELRKWAQDTVDSWGATCVYTFGSLIYKNGDQFCGSSDVDLVIVMPEIVDAPERARWLERLSEHKQTLEGTLVKLLKRSAIEPIVSIVAVTENDIRMDVHKDGHRAFFSQNRFRNLITNVEEIGLPNASTLEPTRFVGASVAFAQKIRNEWFAVSFNTTSKLDSFGGDDPLPKRFMRAAAMAARACDNTLELGAEHDVKAGLDVLSYEAYRLRNEFPAYMALQDLISIRRKARGTGGPVKQKDQLLLAELIYDLAITGLESDDATDPQAYKSESLQQKNQQPDVMAFDTTVQGKAKPVIGDGISIGDSGVAAKPFNNTSPQSLKSDTGLLNMPLGSSTAFFDERFRAAFPGDRRIKWYESQEEIAERLGCLLQPPIVFEDGTPIWWWRGGNLQIENFKKLADGTYLMNVEELAIRRIASVPNESYKRSFVYVETEAMEPTGLYNQKPNDIASRVAKMGYDYEEYGLYMDHHFLTRNEYDDGGTTIDGNLVSTVGKSDLRVRYISPYNFVIAPIGSPINNPAFDSELEVILNDALNNDRNVAVEALSNAVSKLPLREI